MKPDITFVKALGLGLLGGGVLSYAQGWVALMALQPLTLITLTTTRTKSDHGKLLFLWGLGYVLAANFWLGLAIYHPPVNTVWSACLLSCAVFALHAFAYTLVWWVLRLFLRNGYPVSTFGWGICLAIVWPLAEIGRSVGFWAMPWGLLGYAHLDNPLLSGLYPLIGGHGVAGASWLLAALLIEVAKALRWRTPGGRLWVPCGVMALAALTPLLHWTQPSGPALAVRLVHTDLVGDDKYGLEAQQQALLQLRTMAADGLAGLTVFPELFVAHDPGDIAKSFRREVVEAVKNQHGALLFGSAATVADANGEFSSYNTLVLITEDGQTRRYAKELLLPFSEYLPRTPALSWAYDYLYRYPQADLTPGERLQPSMAVRGVTLGVSICSELAYAGKASRQARGAGLLVNASSDSWVPSNAYLAQAHLIARVRAAEAQKPLVRANNVGYSAFIDERGRVIQAVVSDATTRLQTVQPRSGTTPYIWLAAQLADW